MTIKKLKFLLTQKLSTDNYNILSNIFISFAIKGLSLLVSVFSLPIYVHFFGGQVVLGIWFTLISILNWVLNFDLGLGNGLRNKLPYCFKNGLEMEAKSYISSTYFGMFVLIVIWMFLGLLLIPRVNWSNLLNFSTKIINEDTVRLSILIIFFGILLQFFFKIISSIIFAMQKSSLVNFLDFLANFLSVSLILLSPKFSSEDNRLIYMSWINVISVNIPYIAATFFVFGSRLKNYRPSYSFISIKKTREVLNIGVIILWLQLIFMIISNTNEFLIAHFYKTSAVVDYQIYNKIFGVIGSVSSLALIPIWSAVTKAESEENFNWIKKLNSYLLKFSVVILILNLILVPFLQLIVDVWIQKNYIIIVNWYSIVFAIYYFIFFIHNVNTSIGNGISFFRVQIIFMTIAAFLDIPLSILFIRVFSSWIGVVMGNIASLLPYEIFEIIFFSKFINKKRGGN